MPGARINICTEPINIELSGNKESCKIAVRATETATFQCHTADLELVVTRNRGLQMSDKSYYVNFTRDGDDVKVEFCLEKTCKYARLPATELEAAVAELKKN